MKHEKMQRGDAVHIIYSPTVTLYGTIVGLGWNRFQVALDAPAEEVTVGLPKSWAMLTRPGLWQVRLP